MKGIKWMLLVFSIILALGSVNGIPDNDKSFGFVGALSWFGVLAGIFLLGIAFTLIIKDARINIKKRGKCMTDEVSNLAKKLLPEFPEINQYYQTTTQLNNKYLVVFVVLFVVSFLFFRTVLVYGWHNIITILYILFIGAGSYTVYCIDIKLTKSIKELEEAFIHFRDSMISEDA